MKEEKIEELINIAEESGLISANAMQTLNIVDIGAEMQGALGTPALDVQASESIIFSMLVDDSGSIAIAKNEKVIIDGCNLILETLIESKQINNILMHTRFLNGTVLYNYCLVEQAKKMNSSNYQATGGTPLYDQTASLLKAVIAKTTEFNELNVQTRSVSIIITDGRDEHSRKITKPEKIKPIINDMLMQENHIVAAMGIDDGNGTDFKDIFRKMGIEDKWILTPKNTQSEIRKCFQMLSQSAHRMSQGPTSFSQTAMQGLGKFIE